MLGVVLSRQKIVERIFETFMQQLLDFRFLASLTVDS